MMANDKKTKRWIVPIIILVLILLLLLVVLYFVLQREKQPGNVTTAPSQTEQITTGETEPPTTTETVPPTTVTEPIPTETEPLPTETEPVPTQTQPPYVPPVTQPPVTEPPETDPSQIVQLVLAQMDMLKGNSREAEVLTDPCRNTWKVDATEDVELAAQKLLQHILQELNYEEAVADPNVPAGKPNPFTYHYIFKYVDTKNGEHTFVLEYRFVSENYTVQDKGYDTNRLVTDICAYLNSLGKTKFDSQTVQGKTTQSVIVLLEYDYDTVLSMVKAQVQGASENYRSYDFYYKALTVSTKGGVEQTALLFYIINK